ncbi:glycoside hydrolase family 32 protein [Sunxiuqinia sp. A32]|uniref:glycoside hydrolase family 32 protein n=1 Tax=Sunxiuqinia sp. A32 TaxID=3461496 RepID=UPI004045C697
MKITKNYLNIPIGYQARMKLVEIEANGQKQREFPAQLAEDSVNYWIYINVEEFKGQRITLSCPASRESMDRIYQSDEIAGSDSIYQEKYRPQYHFTVKRGWSNDINGPIYLNGQYHLFWQSFPFGLSWNTGFMYWGHAVSSDLIHWEELPPALRLDTLGSPWSGTAIIDKNNDAGFGKGALLLFYTAYDRVSFKQVQCIAYSLDEGKTFQRFQGNPVIDSNWEMGTTHTRDPKVFWHEPSTHWVMVLFEKNGMSFYNSRDLRNWEKQSHFEGLFECPDMFELSVDGDDNNKKWVLHGGSSEYYVGSFDGREFLPETEKLRYAEGTSSWGDLLYASQSFENMPDDRRVQIAWARVEPKGMPFTQMMLFPTEFLLKTTDRGVVLTANPIHEINQLHQKEYIWKGLSAEEANRKMAEVNEGPLHVRMKFTLDEGNTFRLYYQGNSLIELSSDELLSGENQLEILLDKTIAEIFLNSGERYITRQLPLARHADGLVFESFKYGPKISMLEIYEMKSIWKINNF